MISVWHWHTEPLLVGGILFASWLFYSLIGPLRPKLAPTATYPTVHAWRFALATLIFYLTTGSPLDFIGEAFLFWVHMIQHLLLMYICPVLYLWSVPGWLADALLERSVALRRLWSFCVHPLVSGVLFTLTFSLWHVPGLYEAALVSKPIHILEHITIFIPSIFVWWNLMSPSRVRPSMHEGTQMLYLFLLMIAQTPVFAYLVFSGQPLYPTYEFAPRLMEMTPLEDQILGGVVMKLFNVLLFVLLFGIAFYKWNLREVGNGGVDRSDTGKHHAVA